MDSGTALLPIAIAVAVSPVPLIALVLVLMSERRAANSVIFVSALMAFVAFGVLLGVAGSRATGEDSDGSRAVTVILGVFGILLLALGLQNWRNRHDTSEPAVLRSVSTMGPRAVVLLTLGATLANPKNLPLLIGAGAAVAAAARPWLVGAGFVLLATSPSLLVALYARFGGSRAEVNLDRLRGWLIRHNRLVMAIVCLLVGAVLLAQAVTAL